MSALVGPGPGPWVNAGVQRDSGTLVHEVLPQHLVVLSFAFDYERR